MTNINQQLDRFASSVQNFTKFSSDLSTVKLTPPPPASSSVGHPASGKVLSRNVRSNNVILFNLPESSLLDMKSTIDDMSTFLIGKTVKITNAFRIGRKKQPDELSVARPKCRPILIKLDNVWEKRLLLNSCRKLKEFTVKKLYLREDLPPDSRPQGSVSKSRSSNTNLDHAGTSNFESTSSSSNTTSAATVNNSLHASQDSHHQP